MTWKRARRIMYVFLGMLLLTPCIAFAVGWMIFPVPTAEDNSISQVATITFADGESPVATVRPTTVDANGDKVPINRTIVTLDRIPVPVRNALLAAEDRTFYSNPGFDISGIGRAVYNQLTGGVGGGSTITQQYVKISTGEDDFSLWRKYKEVVLAVKISREQTKDQILENYLNTIYLGRGAYGIQAASQAYFGKDVRDLTVSEAAMLVGINPSPSAWDPNKNLAKAQERWKFVLDSMVETGSLTPAERAQQVFPDNWDRPPPDNAGVPSDDRYHIYQQVKAELNAKGITEDMIKIRGAAVTTTINRDSQIAAVDAMKDVLQDQPDNLRAALVSVDPRTGAIQAYFGGLNGVGTDYAQSNRQPGSTFKPFVLTAALESDKGIGLGSTYDGASGQEFPGGVTVDNSEGESCGKCDVKTAMTKSINTVFYRMAIDVGPQKVIDAAHQVGIPADRLKNGASGGIALGDQEVHPTDMASAFGTFAADGVHHEPYLVQKVVAADGEVMYQHDEAQTGRTALDAKVARNVTESMIGISVSSKIPLDGRPVAVKTGTVQKPGSTTGENKDAWTVGYTPSLSTAVWVGTDQSDAIKTADGRNVFGRLLPGAIWQSYMKTVLEGVPEEDFSEFEALGVPPGGGGDKAAENNQDNQDEHENPDEHNDDGADQGNGEGENADEHNDDGDEHNDDGDGQGDGEGDGQGDGQGDGEGDGNALRFPGAGDADGPLRVVVPAAGTDG